MNLVYRLKVYWEQTYLSSKEAKTISFKNLVAKDATTARVIEQRMRKLIKLHEELAYWRIRIVTNGYPELYVLCVMINSILTPANDYGHGLHCG